MHNPEKPKRGAEFNRLMKLAKPALAESLIFKQRKVESLTDRAEQAEQLLEIEQIEIAELSAEIAALREELEVAHVRAASDKQSIFKFRAQIAMRDRQIRRWEAVATLVDTIQEVHDNE